RGGTGSAHGRRIGCLGEKKVQYRTPGRWQRHPYQAGGREADIVGEAGDPAYEVGPFTGAWAFEPEFQDPVADRFGDEQIRLVRGQNDTVGEKRGLCAAP